MPRQTIHRWWYEHLQRAGLVATDVERGMNMHRARHTFATELRRDVGDLGVVQRMLGHADIQTTEAFYGHYDLSDLETAMEAFARRGYLRYADSVRSWPQVALGGAYRRERAASGTDRDRHRSPLVCVI